MIRNLSPMSCHLALVLLLFVPQWLEWSTPKGQADALTRRGLTLGKEQISEAAPYYRRALELYQEVGDPRGQAECEMFLATVEREQDHPEAAIELYRIARARLRLLGDPIGAWMLLLLQGEAELEVGRCHDAILTVEEGLDSIRRIAAISEMYSVETLVAYSRQSYCPNASGWESFSQVNPLIYQMAISALESINLGLVADAHRIAGDLETALAVSEETLTFTRAMALLDQKASLNRKMGLMHLALGRHDQAVEHLDHALLAARRSADWREEVAILRELIDAERRGGRLEAALERGEEILEVAELMDAAGILAEVYGEMSEIYLEIGREQEARDYQERAAEMALFEEP